MRGGLRYLIKRGYVNHRDPHLQLSPRVTIPYPFDSDLILRKRKSMVRQLRGSLTGLQKKRIAILGGSTTADIRQTLDLFLLAKGIDADFYESEYGRFYEDALFGSDELSEFKPDLIFVHTTFRNIDAFPSALGTHEEFEQLLTREIQKFGQCWEKLAETFACPVIQNNFDLPSVRVLGNLDAYSYGGRVHFVNSLNQRFAEAARRFDYLHLHDIQFLSAQIGLENCIRGVCCQAQIRARIDDPWLDRVSAGRAY